MRIAVLLAGYLVMVFVGGGLLAPWVWWLAKGLAGAHPAAWVVALTDHPFHRYVHRCVLVLAVLGLVPLARVLGCRRWRDLGWAADPAWARRVVGGMTVGVAMFLGVAAAEGWLGFRQWRETPGILEVLRRAGAAAVAGIAVGVLEETLFRGVLCGGLRRHTGWPAAIVLSGGVYALLHFLQRPPSPGDLHAGSGLILVGQMVDVLKVPPGMELRGGVLWVAGILLGWLYYRTGSLWVPFGLHAGWIMAIKMGAVLTQSVPDRLGGGRSLEKIGSDALAILVVLVTWGVWAARDSWRRVRAGEGSGDSGSSEMTCG